VNALETWVKNNRRGIFEHATGSGKTFTAMCAIHDAFKRNEVVLVLVPSRDLLKQWDRELRETLLEDKITICFAEITITNGKSLVPYRLGQVMVVQPIALFLQLWIQPVQKIL
jgi:superfamily II DNA or RNA helicase